MVIMLWGGMLEGLIGKLCFKQLLYNRKKVRKNIKHGVSGEH